ncbi:MAG: Ig-like domain-containing protein [Bacteroidales bacterium]|nr:Ig-like domain-containing protein [Bacteroidales bacterium]
MKISSTFFGLIFLTFLTVTGCKKDQPVQTNSLQLISVKSNTTTLTVNIITQNIKINTDFEVSFSTAVDTASIRSYLTITNTANSALPLEFTYSLDQKTVFVHPLDLLAEEATYNLNAGAGIKGMFNETFAGASFPFTTAPGILLIEDIKLNQTNFNPPAILKDVRLDTTKIVIRFSRELDPDNYASFFQIEGYNPITTQLSEDKKTVTAINVNALKGWTKYMFSISSDLKSADGNPFEGLSNSFYTTVDSTYKFPMISDTELLDLVEKQTFKYFYDEAHPVSGMARERNTSGDVVTSGGSGFGVMVLIVGMERGYITREEGITRLDKIISFLETCDRFHGAWPHWINGTTGRVVPFTTKDDGGDLVETSYMIQGLITMSHYLNQDNTNENLLIDRITQLVETVEYDWYTRGENVLYWHWSPNYNWDMNMQIRGYNETLITYVVAAASPTHPISAEVYHNGYAQNGGIVNGSSYYGYELPLGWSYGGPLFFTHYSFLGLDPRNLTDTYADYWKQNVNQSLINYAYCVDNPRNYVGYSSACWGLTASDNPWGYNAQSPGNDLGVISPTAAVSAIAYTPEQSMEAIRFFYYVLGDRLWGSNGFHDAFDPSESWWATSYLAIDQGPQVCMIENHRTGLLWNLFMSDPNVRSGLTNLGFTY